MGYNSLDISDGWQLGWYREPALNHWHRDYNYWEIKDGWLTGRKEPACNQAFIYANCASEKDYIFSCKFTIPKCQSAIRICLFHSVVRLSQYSVNLRPGERISIHYVFSDLFDHAVLDGKGPVLEADREYDFRVEYKGETADLYLDGALIASFAADAVCGRYTALSVINGQALFADVVYKDVDTGDVLFSDDFSRNTLLDYVDVELEENKCKEWIPADIPGSVHTSLLKAGKIEDPYVGFNGPKQMWIDDQRWVYKKKFSVPADMKGKSLRLVFDGVDYHAHFWLNGKKLCYHEGMFGGPEVDISELVDYDAENELIVCILPCPSTPHNIVRPFILHRWHFNMDIQPIGIWRNVRLVANDKIFLQDPQVITKEICDHEAVVQVSVTLGNMALWPFEIKGKVILRSPDKHAPIITGSFSPGFCQGYLRVDCVLKVPNPKLWWPNGLGEQNLYDIDIIADIYEGTGGSEPTGHDEIHLKTGIRTLRMEPVPAPHQPKYPQPISKTDPDGLYNWRFSINGRQFFGKGANWMPIDQMLDLPRERYELLLRRAKECNINILRPWGAGLLETEDFYDLCDELGICVWQEILMANGCYDQSDIMVWRDTVHKNVLRLRNHPSLVLWCGGNEFDPDCAENKEIVDDMESICTELDPTREFHRACPYGGDNHSYIVNWMNGMDYSQYTRDLSVAITEFSMASPPSMDTMKRMIPEKELAVFPPDRPDNIELYGYSSWGSDVKRCESHFSMHDAHLSSITNIMIPPMSDCGVPKNWEEFIRYMQTAHGLLTQFGIDFWRSRWPDCTAAMSWVFNVIFPDTFSWSYVDYFGIPKRSYYYKKRSFEPLHVGAVFDDLFNRPGNMFRAKLFAVNETLECFTDATVRVRLYNVKLNLLASDTRKLSLSPDKAKHCGYFQWRIPEDAVEETLFLCVDLISADGNLLSRSQYCSRIGCNEGKMPFLDHGPWISDVTNASTELAVQLLWHGPDKQCDTLLIRIENTGMHPAFQVSIEVPGSEKYLSYADNYFWLEAGEHREIEIKNRGDGIHAVEVYAWNAAKQILSIP